MTATACTALGLILAGLAAYARSVLAGREQPVRSAVVRARWAWRCRSKPAITSEHDPLDRGQMRAFLAIVETWRHDTAPAERSRT